MSTSNVKVIHLDGQDFSVESSSDASSESSSQSSSESQTSSSSSHSASEEPDKTPKEAEEESDCDTAELLAADPLYFILSRLLMTPSGKNLATVLDEINGKLDALLKK